MLSVPVPINVRCYSNSDIVVRRSEVTLRAIFDILPCIKDREPITTECVAGSYVPGAKVKLAGWSLLSMRPV